MINSKIVLLISQLSASELERLSAFLVLNKHKVRKQCSLLFDILISAYSQSKTEGYLDKSKICTTIFGSPDKTSSLNTLCVEAINHLKDFYSYIEYEKDENLKSSLFQKSVNKSALSDLFSYQFPKDLKKLNDRKFESISYYQANFNFQIELLEFATKVKSKEVIKKLEKKLQIEKSSNLSTLYGIIDSFKLFTLVNEIRIACLVENKKAMKKPEQYDFTDVETIKSKVDDALLNENPLINLYYNTLLTLTGDHEKYKKVLSLVNVNNATQFKEEIPEILALLFNHFSRQINDGKYHFSKDRFDLYFKLYEVEKSEKKTISSLRLKNLITLALREKEFELAKNLYNDNCKKIPQNLRYSLKYYYLGLMHFCKGEFEETFSIIFQKLNKISSPFKMNCRLLLFKSYFELKENRSFENERDNFKRFVSKNKGFTKKQKEENINFINLLNRVNVVRNLPNLDYKKLNAIKRDYAKLAVIDKLWLKDKIDELEKPAKQR